MGCHAFRQRSSQLRDQTRISASLAPAGGLFTTSATWEAHNEDNAAKRRIALGNVQMWPELDFMTLPQLISSDSVANYCLWFHRFPASSGPRPWVKGAIPWSRLRGTLSSSEDPGWVRPAVHQLHRGQYRWVWLYCISVLGSVPAGPSDSDASLHLCVLCDQSCRLCDPVNCNLPSSSVHGIFQTRILGWVAMPSFRGSSWPRDQTCISCVSCIGRWFLYHCTTWEAHGRRHTYINSHEQQELQKTYLKSNLITNMYANSLKLQIEYPVVFLLTFNSSSLGISKIISQRWLKEISSSWSGLSLFFPVCLAPTRCPDPLLF